MQPALSTLPNSVRPERRASLPSFPHPLSVSAPPSGQHASRSPLPSPLRPQPQRHRRPRRRNDENFSPSQDARCPCGIPLCTLRPSPVARWAENTPHSPWKRGQPALDPLLHALHAPLHPYTAAPFARPLHSPTAPTRTPVASITGCPLRCALRCALRVAPGVVSSSARHEDFSRPFPSLDGNRYAICIIYTIAGGKPVYIRQPRPFAPLFVALLRPSHCAPTPFLLSRYYFYPREHLVDKGARSGIPFFHSPTSRHQKVSVRVSAKEITGITASTVYIHTVLR